MASNRATNTMVEVLQRILQDIALAKTLPDADLGFLVQMETMILQKLQAPIAAASGSPNGVLPQTPPQGLPPGMGGPGAGGPPGAPIPVTPAPPGGGVPGLMNGPPNMDEFRRAIAGAGGQ